jgi:hypothetical protein
MRLIDYLDDPVARRVAFVVDELFDRLALRRVCFHEHNGSLRIGACRVVLTPRQAMFFYEILGVFARFKDATYSRTSYSGEQEDFVARAFNGLHVPVFYEHDHTKQLR